MRDGANSGIEFWIGLGAAASRHEPICVDLLVLGVSMSSLVDNMYRFGKYVKCGSGVTASPSRGTVCRLHSGVTASPSRGTVCRLHSCDCFSIKGNCL